MARDLECPSTTVCFVKQFGAISRGTLLKVYVHTAADWVMDGICVLPMGTVEKLIDRYATWMRQIGFPEPENDWAVSGLRERHARWAQGFATLPASRIAQQPPVLRKTEDGWWVFDWPDMDEPHERLEGYGSA